MPLGSNRTKPSSRFLKSTFLLASGLSLFLSGCLSGVADEKAAVDSPSALAVGMATPSAQVEDISAWTDADIGAVGQAGSSTVSGSSATVRGSGADIWGQADGFHFKYKEFFTHPFILTTRVTGLQATDPWAKAGIMVRWGTAPDAPHVFLALTSANGVAFQKRSVSGGESFHTGEAGGSPVWLRLKVTSSDITGFRSNDGVNWTLVNTAPNYFRPPDMLIGLAVTSHNNAALNAATFDNITWVVGELPPRWTAEDIGNVGLAGRTIFSFQGRGIPTWSIAGAGDDIYNSADAFHFCHRPQIGDGAFRAQILSLDNTHEWAKAGIMMRETNSPGSRFVYIGLTPTGVVEFLRREVEGGSTIAVTTPPVNGTTFPFATLVYINRTGNVFTVEYDPPGGDFNPIQLGQVTMDLKPDILVGLAVTSHDRSVRAWASFSGIPPEL